MRILIPSIQVPFIKGGAELMTTGLAQALIDKGHEVEIIKLPFKFSPESSISDLIDIWKKLDFNNFNGYVIDKVIVLQFPAYYVQHNNKVLWLMHQHRSVYELYQPENVSNELKDLRKKIHNNDSVELLNFKSHFSMCQNITNRLKKYNNIDSIPVYHPPAHEEKFYCDDSYDYIFYPSRVEELKRQYLLIQAMQYTKTNAISIIAGEGGQLENYKKLAKDLNVDDKISFLGHITEEDKYKLFARSLGVFFAPFDEDYGYITLEAMLSSKPVITCKDSGGPLEFVVDSETGFIVDPDPRQIAQKIDFLYQNKQLAKKLGEKGLKTYNDKNICWNNVIETLLGNNNEY